MATIQTRPITIEEFESLPYATTERKELVRGEMIEKMSPGAQHGTIQLAIGSILREWARSTQSGSAGVEAEFVLATDPPTVRLADVSFVRASRYAQSGIPDGFWHLAPDLAVEIISPSESADSVQDKVQDYLAAGTALVLTIWPRRQEILAHTPDGIARTYRIGDTLEFPDVLPGFSCPVDAIFAL